jgi:hypothetical protein
MYVSLESSTLRLLLRRRVRKAAEELKKMGINPHANEQHVEITLGNSETDPATGKMKIYAWGVLNSATMKHEGAHRAHILNTHAPTPRLRKEKYGKYMEEIPSSFGAISETFATLAEGKVHGKMHLVRKLDLIHKYYGPEQDSEAMILSVRNKVFELWDHLGRRGMNNEEKRWMVTQALYHSKDLRELNENVEAAKLWAELRRAGISANLREVLAMKQLGRWKRGRQGT